MSRPVSTVDSRSKTPNRGGRPRIVAEVLQNFLRTSGMQQSFEDHRVVELWEEIAGAQLAVGTRPMKIERGVLWIGVKSAPLANQLHYLKPAILDRIRKVAPGARVRDIRILHQPEDPRRRA